MAMLPTLSSAVTVTVVGVPAACGDGKPLTCNVVATPDPTGGRIERGPGNVPTGILREAALDQVAPLVARHWNAIFLNGALFARIDALFKLYPWDRLTDDDFFPLRTSSVLHIRSPVEDLKQRRSPS